MLMGGRKKGEISQQEESRGEGAKREHTKKASFKMTKFSLSILVYYTHTHPRTHTQIGWQNITLWHLDYPVGIW